MDLNCIRDFLILGSTWRLPESSKNTAELETSQNPQTKSTSSIVEKKNCNIFRISSHNQLNWTRLKRFREFTVHFSATIESWTSFTERYKRHQKITLISFLFFLKIIMFFLISLFWYIWILRFEWLYCYLCSDSGLCWMRFQTRNIYPETKVERNKAR